MSDEQNAKPDVYEAPRFTKALEKLPHAAQEIVENAIDEIIADPTIGEHKRGDLSYMWVHKLNVGQTLYLLGYNWNEVRIELHLLQLGAHENYYRDAKARRKADLKLLKSNPA
jgi:mRNA-degrading endonuclease RelE of RelBE toxin-antitoxin system